MLLVSFFFAFAFVVLTGISFLFLILSKDRPEEHMWPSIILTILLVTTFTGAVISLAVYAP